MQRTARLLAGLRALHAPCSLPASAQACSPTSCQHRGYDSWNDDGDGEGESLRGRVIPWTRSVVSGMQVIQTPKYNKGLAFTEAERDRLYLRGLIPPAVLSQATQMERVMINVRSMDSDLQRFSYLHSLQERNERLFYTVLHEHFEELLPSVHLPTVRLACETYGLMFKSLPRALFLTSRDLGMVQQVLKNWPERRIKVVMITPGQHVGPAGDLGVHAVGAAISKLSLISALGCVAPSLCVPILTDFGTSNEELLSSQFYVGLRQPRADASVVESLMQELMDSIERRHGNNVMLFLEDMQYPAAKKLLSQYRTRFPCFADDYEGTAATALAGVLGAVPATGTRLSDHRILIVGCGSHRIAVAEMLATAIAAESRALPASARERIWFADSSGLVTATSEHCTDDEDMEQGLYAKDEPDELDVTKIVERIKPTLLIGLSSFPDKMRQLPESAVREMAKHCETPLIMALSSPQPEVSAADAYAWTDGRALYANSETGPREVTLADGSVRKPSKCQSVYVFPGLTLGTVVARSTRIRQEQLVAAAQTVASLVTDEDRAEGRILPGLDRATEVAHSVAHTVAQKAYDLNIASNLPKPHNLRAAIAAASFDPSYKLLR